MLEDDGALVVFTVNTDKFKRYPIFMLCFSARSFKEKILQKIFIFYIDFTISLHVTLAVPVCIIDYLNVRVTSYHPIQF